VTQTFIVVSLFHFYVSSTACFKETRVYVGPGEETGRIRKPLESNVPNAAV